MTSEGQRIVQEFDTSDDDAVPGRHRAPASAIRRTAVRLGIAGLCVLLATGLGAVTADALGLTEVGQLASQGGPPPVRPQDPEEKPRGGRTVDLPTRPALPTPPPADPPTAPAPQLSPASAATAVADPPAPAPETRETTTVRTVRTGDSCRDVGQIATTARGGTAVCTASRGNGPNKWRGA